MNARLRRLYADYRKILEEFSGHPHIQVSPLKGDPPEAYRVVFRVRGLRLDKSVNRPIAVNEHRALIYLHEGYPREKPRCTMETEVFHPNISPQQICVGDYWTPGESIADLIIQIGEMIQYRNYNTKSPLDGVAARWAEINGSLLPVGDVDLYQPDVDIDLLDVTPQGAHSGRPRPQELDIELI